MVLGNATFKETMEVITKAKSGIALIVDDKTKLLGIMTDGDIRRAILKGVKLSTPISKVMNRNPLVLKKGVKNEKVLKTMLSKTYTHIPIVNANGEVVDIADFTNLKELMGSEEPAILGGDPISCEMIPISQPTLPSFNDLNKEGLESMFATGVISNGKYVRLFEEKMAEYLGVKHVVAVSNCTLGLILSIQALELKGSVLVPSFTFCATVHSLLWNNLRPVFVDCDPETLNIDPKEVVKNITRDTSAIFGVYVFGNPPDIKSLEEIAREYNLKLIFDAAQGLGSQYNGKYTGGFGDVEVFSLSPTKTLTAGEGGLVATNNPKIAEKLRMGRNYGHAGDYNCRFPGLNARLSEFNAILGQQSLEMIDQNIQRRNELARLYKLRLKKIPGLSFQKVEPRARSAYNYFCIIIDPFKFGLRSEEFKIALEKENINTKRYFYPPVHWQLAYSNFYDKYRSKLSVTEYIAENILCLPLYSHISKKEIERICRAIEKIYKYKEKIKNRLRPKIEFKSDSLTKEIFLELYKSG
jgi:dTDP-4-amino-4,6-dideoxygalactose transaminase